MKKMIFLVLPFITGIAIAQSQPTVTINTTGNRNKQIVVDGNYYSINNTSANDEQAVEVKDLAIGQHTLQVVRSNQYNNRTSISPKTNFTLREGYDLTITVSANGSITSAETRMERGGNGNGNNRWGRGQLSENAFNRLYSQTKSKVSSSSRATYLDAEFDRSNRRMTSKQASQLIQLVNSESLRLSLAKKVYVHVSDRENFSLVSNLLSSSYRRNELKNYIATIPADNDDDVADTDGPITNDRFQIVYNEVVAEQSSSDKTYYLNNFFGREFNTYTASQAKQLIELVSSQTDRLTLAKAAYRGVTDKNNYTIVYPLLNSNYDRSALTAYVNNYNSTNGTGATVGVAMSSTDFDRLYQSIYYMSSSARYTAINNAFNMSGNYFTVDQARKLIILVNDESSRLQLAKSSYKALVDRDNYTRYNEFLNSTASRNEWNAYVRNYSETGNVNVNVAMSDADFNTMYKTVNSAWSNSSRTSQIGEAFRNNNNYFTTYQVRQLLSLVTSENDKMTLAKSAYDNIIDINNYSLLYDLFASSSNRNELAAFANSMQNGNGTMVRIPMSESEFNQVYREIQLTFGLGAKYTSLSTLFNTETNYFTVAQAKQLIQLVSSESNRLELAKASYNNITDPNNFSQLYDIFSSQVSRNELMAYVGANAYNR